MLVGRADTQVALTACTHVPGAPSLPQVLYHGTAHRHMVAALLHPHVWKLLTPQQRARVQQVQQQPMPPHSLLGGQQQEQEQALLPPPELSVMDCLEVMRDILLGVMAAGQLQQLVRGLERCLCGAERMTEGETVEQRAGAYRRQCGRRVAGRLLIGLTSYRTPLVLSSFTS